MSVTFGQFLASALGAELLRQKVRRDNCRSQAAPALALAGLLFVCQNHLDSWSLAWRKQEAAEAVLLDIPNVDCWTTAS